MVQQSNSVDNKSSGKLREAVRSFSALTLIWLLLMLISSVFEIILYGYNNPLPNEYYKLILSSWILDLRFWLYWLFPIGLFYMGLAILWHKLAKNLLVTLIVLFFCVHFLLISYFNASLVMLGADLFGYSIEDIKLTVGASGNFGIGSILILLSVLTLIAFALLLLSKKLKPNLYVSIGMLTISLLLIIFGSSDILGKSDFNSDFANSIVTNKSEHFYKSAHDYYFGVGYEVDIYADNYLLGDETTSRAKDFVYIDETYPFLHGENDKDVLSPFFQFGEKSPNIVVIIMEGMGRAFTNKNAYLGNFTPFMDSLSTKSLYWKNFLSNGGRTFAVLPSLLGSLPFGENGIMSMGVDIPKHLSLINMLANNGYDTSFYYGGDSNFDDMADYLKYNGIDNVYDEKTFKSSDKKMPGQNGFTWGYGDKEIYSHYLNQQVKNRNENPQLSIILTTATHNPFLINEGNEYSSRFERRMNELEFGEEQKERARNYNNQFKTILYADNELRKFFTAYSQRDEYENTIFLITGDHRIPEIPMSTKLDRYHVPFIIYSPMLKRTAEIASISTHFDVTPSLINYLKKNHSLKAPKMESWMGKGLDTTRNFQNIHKVPLKQTKSDLLDFVMGKYHLNGDQLFQINEHMGEDLIENPSIKEQMLRDFNAFKEKNQKLIDGAKIIPDSIYKKYTKKN